MDTLGDAPELPDEDWRADAEQHRAGRGWVDLLSPEAFAVASLGLGLVSFFASSMFGWLGFLIADRGPGAGLGWQYLSNVAPTLLIASLGILFGRLALRRASSSATWLRGVAGGGMLVCGVTAALSLVAVVIAFTLNPSDGAPPF